MIKKNRRKFKLFYLLGLPLAILVLTILALYYSNRAANIKKCYRSEEKTVNEPPTSISPAPSLPVKLTYNVRTAPPFKPEQRLQDIVRDILVLAQSRGLPIELLSISLVDLSKPQCCSYGSYLDNERRYPASVVKLFWLVVLYSQYEYQGISPLQISSEQLKKLSKMIKDSDNETASMILDEITETKSSQQELTPDRLKDWIAKRHSVNNFFTQAGYQNINISQKTFPISHLLDLPKGPDWQIRQINRQNSSPIRNFLTTRSVARLLYEIESEQAISRDYSQAVKSLLKRDLHPQAWKDKPYNAIACFLGESLLADTQFYSKMGWTFSNRNDAAIIASPDRRARYILVVFGDDPKFYEDKEFFPKLSRKVYSNLAPKKVDGSIRKSHLIAEIFVRSKFEPDKKE